MAYKEIGPLSLTSDFRTLRDKVNAWGERIDDIKLITEPDSVFTSDLDQIPRVGDVQAFVIALNLILE
jgi:hypothetical protein